MFTILGKDERSLVRSPGFEPGIISLEGLHTAHGYRRFNVLNQTRRRPHCAGIAHSSSVI